MSVVKAKLQLGPNGPRPSHTSIPNRRLNEIERKEILVEQDRIRPAASLQSR